jgi:oxepin-CoA hydrolase/3-oxo-5,6-dehydrosuberyl-CoA semialdehyde dehydrogenase
MTCQPGLNPGQVRFTVKEKVDRENRTPEDPAKAGQVVFDETGETVAIATILTMVKKLDQK